MKVILTENIEVLGQAGEVIDVRSGYARNFLMPRGRAVAATPGALKSLQAEKGAKERRLAKDIKNFQETGKSLEGLTLEFVRRTGEKGKLFGSLTTGHIAAGLKAKGMSISKRQIILEEKIKRLGKFDVKIKLHPEVEAVVHVVLKAKEETADKKKKKSPPSP